MDWAAFYRTLLSTARIPAVSNWEFRQGHGYIRDLHVDLKEAIEQFRAKSPTPTLLTICADVVTMPQDYKLNLEKHGLVIAARRIEFGAGPNSYIFMDLRKSPRASLKLFAQEIYRYSSNVFPVQLWDPWGRDKEVPAADQKITPRGLSITCFDDEIGSPATDIHTGAGMEAMLREDSPLALSLASIFHVATLLLDRPEHADLVASQLAWIGACAAQSPRHAGLAVQSAGLLSMVQTRKLGSTFVPELSRTVYAETARAHVPQVIEYERQYDRFEDQRTSAEDRIEAAKLLLAKADDAVALSRKLIGQAEANLQNGVAALTTAKTNLTQQRKSVEKAGGQFQVSVEWWIEKQKFELSIKIITSVIQAGAAIGEIACGDMSLVVPSAFDIAIRELQAAARAGDSDAGKRADLAQTLLALKKMLQSLMKVFELAQELVKQGTSLDSAIQTATELTAADVIDTGSVSNGPEEWDIFRIRMDDAVQPAIDRNIDDSIHYRQQLRILAVYGKALTIARATVVQLGQELLRLRLVAYNHEKETDRLKQYIADLEKTREAKAGLRQMFFQRYLDAKRSLFVALEQYRAAYVYWALAPSSVKPSLTDRVSVFENGLKDLANIALDNQAALANFQPRPQTLNKSFLINDPSLLARLKQDNETTWTIPLDERELVGYDRVRITKVRVWLIGAKPASTRELYIIIKNSGNYLDRRRVGNQQPVPYQFITKPLEQVFSYKTEQSSGTRVDVMPGMPAWVEMDGDVHDEVRYAYFVPTVFSQWSIRVPETKNQNLELSGVTAIRMDVAGSAIPSTQLQGGRRAEAH